MVENEVPVNTDAGDYLHVSFLGYLYDELYDFFRRKAALDYENLARSF